MRHSSFALVSLSMVALACQGDLARSVDPAAGNHARSTNTEVTSRWEFLAELSDGTPAAIRGDGRAADGKSFTLTAGVTGIYENARCGVRTRLFVPGAEGSGSGDATIDPDVDWSKGTKCERRSFDLTLTNAETGEVTRLPSDGPFTNARNVWSVEAVGGTRDTPMVWWPSLANCERLAFGDINVVGDAEGRAGVTITREADVAGRRVWTVQTNAPHTARCVSFVRGEYVWSGPVYVVPYRVRITEMR